jgi:hypothetical protein
VLLRSGGQFQGFAWEENIGSNRQVDAFWDIRSILLPYLPNDHALTRLDQSAGI